MSERTTPEQRAELARLAGFQLPISDGYLCDGCTYGGVCPSDDPACPSPHRTCTATNLTTLLNAVPTLLAGLAAAEAERDKLARDILLVQRGCLTHGNDGLPLTECAEPTFGRCERDALRARIAELEAMLPHEEGDHA